MNRRELIVGSAAIALMPAAATAFPAAAWPALHEDDEAVYFTYEPSTTALHAHDAVERFHSRDKKVYLLTDGPAVDRTSRDAFDCVYARTGRYDEYHGAVYSLYHAATNTADFVPTLLYRNDDTGVVMRSETRSMRMTWTS